MRTALRDLVTYHLSWFDAQMWAYAETNGIDTIFSEDYEHRRLYGTAQVVNPFA